MKRNILSYLAPLLLFVYFTGTPAVMLKAQDTITKSPSAPKHVLLKESDWKTTWTVYDTARKKIYINSSGIKKKTKGLERLVTISVDSCKTKAGECRFIIEGIKYYKKTERLTVISNTDKFDDNIKLSLFPTYPGTTLVAEGDVSGSSKEIQVDCNVLGNYLGTLPVNYTDCQISHTCPETENDNYKKIVFGLSATVGATYGTVSVDTSYYENPEQLNRRIESQEKLVGYNYSFIFGFRPAPKHIIYFEASYGMMGFETRYHAVNWQTGYLGDPKQESTKYLFRNFSVGVGYILAPSPEPRKFKYIVQLGAYYSMNSGKTYEAKGGANSTDSKFIRLDRFGGKVGAGATYGLCKKAYLQIMPSYQFDFTPINRGKLSTRLKLAGLNIGVIMNL